MQEIVMIVRIGKSKLALEQNDPLLGKAISAWEDRTCATAHTSTGEQAASHKRACYSRRAETSSMGRCLHI